MLHDTAARLLRPTEESALKVNPAPMQGSSMSYTCIVNIHYGQSNRATVQFRRAKLNLAATNEAHAIHGPIVPPIIFYNIHHQLFVYVSPFAEGQPFINILMSSEGDPPLSQLLQTATHLASMFVGRIRTEKDILMPANTLSIMSDLEQKVRTLICESGTRQLISRAIDLIKSNAELVDSLRLALAHPDLTPFNYLVDTNGGRS